MILLAVVLAPLSLAVLFIVMSWTERALDHQVAHQTKPTTLADGTRWVNRARTRPTGRPND